MAWLEVSDIVFVVPGWDKSKGTLAELDRAEELDIPIVWQISELRSLLNPTKSDK